MCLTLRHRRHFSPFPRAARALGRVGRAALLCAGGFVLAIGAVHAATVQLGSGYTANGWLFVPVEVTVASGDTVAGLQFDLQYDSARMGLYDVEAGITAANAGKTVTYSQLADDRVRVLVTGFNQEALAAGDVVTLVMEPYAAGETAQGLQISSVVAADPLGESVPVSEPAEDSSADDTEDASAPAALDPANDTSSSDTDQEPTASNRTSDTSESSESSSVPRASFGVWGGGYSSLDAGDETASSPRGKGTVLPRQTVENSASRGGGAQRFPIGRQAPVPRPITSSSPSHTPFPSTPANRYVPAGGPSRDPDAPGMISARPQTPSISRVVPRSTGGVVRDFALKSVQAGLSATVRSASGVFVAEPGNGFAGTRLLGQMLWTALTMGLVFSVRTLVFRHWST